MKTQRPSSSTRAPRRPLAAAIERLLREDPATFYARQVVDGRIVTGPLVELACERHLKDLKDGPKRGLEWRVDLTQKIYGYFRDVLRLNGGQFEGIPFELVGTGAGGPWQAFIVGSLFGWIGPDGGRRFRTAFVEIGKGNGKSPMAAGLGMYFLTSDGEERAECYAAASHKDQAMILFRDAVAMREWSPALAKRVIPYGGLKPYQLFYPRTNSFFKAISADDRQSGPRPSYAACDELHEHPDGTVVGMLRDGFKFRRNPLLMEITNSGVDRTSICYEHHDYSTRVLEGRVEDDAWFAYVCGLAKRDNWKNPKVWIKANPNLGVSVFEKYLREQVKTAEGMPSQAATVRRLNFCQWVGASTPWIDVDKWTACEYEGLDLSQYRGSRCWAGLDLSTRTDLTALALVFLRPDGKGLDAFLFFWTPEDGIREREDRDKVPYTVWRDAGHLEATPGGVVSYEHVARRIIHFREAYGLDTVAFDRFRIKDLIRELDDAGFEYSELKMDADEKTRNQARGLVLVEHGQGFRDMTPAVDSLTAAVVGGQIRVKTNPVLTWNSSNAVITSGSAEERKFDKRKARGRIDGIVALAMGVRAAQVFSGRRKGTIYDTEELLTV